MLSIPDSAHQVNAPGGKWTSIRRLLGSSLLVATCPVLAATQQGVSETDYLEDIPVVLSPTRLAQPVTEAPAAITVIDRAMIEASGARQIADLFRLVPGFTVAYFNGYTPSVAYHGFADEYSRRMQVLIDGRSVYLPSIGGVAWNDLPLTIDDIERIEVIRGSDSASYGSNSFLGVISITTRQPSEDKGTHLHVANGQHHVHDGTLRFGAGSRALSYRLTAGYREDDGFNNRYDTQETRLFNARAEYQLSVRDNLDGQFGASDGPRQTSYNNDSFDPQRSSHSNTNFEQLRWLHVASSTQEYSIQFYHNYNATDDEFMTQPTDIGGGFIIPPLPLNLGVRTERFDLEFQHTLTPGAAVRVVWGASTRQDQVWAPTYFSTNDALHNNIHRLFGNVEWHILPSFVTNMGAMLENDGITGTTISPRAAANYHVTEHQTLRAVLATATRSPTLFENQGNFKYSFTSPYGTLTDQQYLTNGSLHPERILSREIGYLFYWPERGTSLDIKIYNDRLRDLIGADKVCTDIASRQAQLTGSTPACDVAKDNVDYNYQYFHNINLAIVKGLEFQLDQHIGADTRVIAGYAYTQINDQYALVGAVPSTPTNNLHLMLMQKLPADMSGSLIYYQLGNMEYQGSGNHTNTQKRLDMRLARNFRYAFDKFQVALVVQNMMHSYQDFLYDARGPSYGPSNLFDTRAFVEFKCDLP